MPREWHGGYLAPGTPAGRSRPVEVACLACDHPFQGVAFTELGTTDLTPEECPECGSGELEIL